MRRLVDLQLVGRGLGSVRLRVLRRRGLRDSRHLRVDLRRGLGGEVKTTIMVEEAMEAAHPAADPRLGSRVAEVAEAAAGVGLLLGNSRSSNSRAMEDMAMEVEEAATMVVVAAGTVEVGMVATEMATVVERRVTVHHKAPHGRRMPRRRLLETMCRRRRHRATSHHHRRRCEGSTGHS